MLQLDNRLSYLPPSTIRLRTAPRSTIQPVLGRSDIKKINIIPGALSVIFVPVAAITINVVMMSSPVGGRDTLFLIYYFLSSG